MGRTRGKQKGWLKRKGPSWIGYWKEPVLNAEGQERWKTFNQAICDSDRTKKQAQAEFDRQILNKLAAVSRHPQSQATVAEFWERKFEPQIRKAKSKNTRIQYTSLWKRHIKPAMGGKRLREVRRDFVQQLIWLKAEKLSPASVEHVRKVISAIFEYAITIEYFDGDNPASRIEKPPKRPVRRNVAYSYEQARTILEALSEPVKNMALMSLCCTPNVAEMAGLHWKHVNLTDQFVMVEDEAIPPCRAAIRFNWTVGELRPTKTDNRVRTIPLPPAVVEALKKLRAASKFTGPDDFVFCNRKGGPVDAHNITNRVFADLKVGVKVNWHSFRHTAATWAETEMPESDRRALMGHAGETVTDRYTHENLERQAAAVARIADNLMAAAVNAPPQQERPKLAIVGGRNARKAEEKK